MPAIRIITGIVLRQIPYGEAEKLFIFITPTGKQKAFAKGVKKITSKNAAHLEIFTHANVQLVEGHSDRKIIAGAVSKHRFDEFAYDIEKYALAMFACEMVDVFAQENDDTAYNELLDFFMYLKTKQYTKNVILLLLNRITYIAGVNPQLENCVTCDAEITPDDLFYSYSNGGVVCKYCMRQADIINIDLLTLKILRNVYRQNNKPIAVELPLGHVKIVSEILFKQTMFYAEQKIKTWSMVNDVVLK